MIMVALSRFPVTLGELSKLAQLRYIALISKLGYYSTDGNNVIESDRSVLLTHRHLIESRSWLRNTGGVECLGTPRSLWAVDLRGLLICAPSGAWYHVQYQRSKHLANGLVLGCMYVVERYQRYIHSHTLHVWWYTGCI